MTILPSLASSGGAPTLPSIGAAQGGLASYPRRAGPPPVVRMSRGGMSPKGGRVNKQQPLPDAHCPMQYGVPDVQSPQGPMMSSQSARGSRSARNQTWSLDRTERLAAQKPTERSVFSQQLSGTEKKGSEKGPGSFITGLYHTNHHGPATSWKATPSLLSPKELSDDDFPDGILPRDERPKAPEPLSNRTYKSAKRRRKRESEKEEPKSQTRQIKESDADVRNIEQDEEGRMNGDSLELGNARAIAEMTRPHATWDALNWLELRQQSLDSCKPEDVRALMNAAHKSTQKALENNSYVSETGMRMNLMAHMKTVRVAQWFGRENLNVADLPADVEGHSATVPMIVAELEALDIVRRLKNAGMSNQMNVLTEITEFDRSTGEISKQCNASSVQQSCLLQTDFSCFVSAASRQYSGATSTIEEHLRAAHDPYVCLCPEVILFRGTRDDGYPFLDDPLSMNVIFSSLPEARPLVQVSPDGSEWYADEKDQTALLERLNLIGLVALQKLSLNATDSETLPVLVMNAFGIGGRGKHPRDAVANSLKHWRKGYGRYFHCVIIACGSDRDLALHMDQIINEQVYATLIVQQTQDTIQNCSGLMEDHAKFWSSKKATDLEHQNEMMELGKWHWDADILALHCRNLELQSAGRRAKEWYQREMEKKQAEQEEAEKRRLLDRQSDRKSISKESVGDFCRVESPDLPDVPRNTMIESPRNLGKFQMDPDSPDLPDVPDDLDEIPGFEARISLKLNGSFFMSNALADMGQQMGDRSRPGSRGGSRRGSPKGSRPGSPSGFRNRTASMEVQKRQNSVSAEVDVDLLEESPLRRRSWGDGYESPKASRPSSAIGMRERNSFSLLTLPGTENGSKNSMESPRKNSMQCYNPMEMELRKNSVDLGRKNSMDAGRKNSMAGADIISMNLPMTGLGEVKKDEKHPSPKRSGSKELKPADQPLDQEEIRRQARDKLRGRRGSAQPELTPEASKKLNETAEKVEERWKDEGELLVDVQQLAGRLQHRLENKRANYVRQWQSMTGHEKEKLRASMAESARPGAQLGAAGLAVVQEFDISLT